MLAPCLALAGCDMPSANGAAAVSGGVAGPPVVADAGAEPSMSPDASARGNGPPTYEPITLRRFECGDNCYVEFTRPGTGATRRALCTARTCSAWRDRGSLPPPLRGMTVLARFGMADQVDASGTVMRPDVEAIVDLRVGDRARGARVAPASATLPLRRGVYVVEGVPCGSAPNAAVRVWNGTGLSGSATRFCRPTVLERTGDRYTVENSCENTYDGSRTAERQVIAVPDPHGFTLDGQRFRMCAPGTAPAAFEAVSAGGPN